MSFWITIQTAMRALRRNRIRSALTMLGIVIGIASVIAMVALGHGASAMIQDQINSMGRNMLMIMPGAAASGGFSWGAGSVTTLTPSDGEALLDLPGIRAATPAVRVRDQMLFENRNWFPGDILGVDTGFLDVRDWAMEDGHFFTEHDVAAAKKVCVLGATVAGNLFADMSPVGKDVRLGNMPFRVLGVLSRKGTNAMGQDQDDVVLIPWMTVKRVLQRSMFNNVGQILVSVESIEDVPPARDEITSLLRQRHRIRDGEASDFRILTMTEMAGAAAQTSSVMTLLLAIIASVSLVVGGIGIMNIMLVSVTERTREIGLRMAIGARKKDILIQFLVESSALSAVAGIVGILAGVAAASAMSHTLRWPTLIAPEAVGLAFVFSCAVGAFFGFYPAFRASRLDPIEALRYE